MYDEFPFFSPTQPSEIFMVKPEEARGVNCRLGSKGIIAETHYDQSRNFIFILQGQKRYILAHPKECMGMELYPNGHPSVYVPLLLLLISSISCTIICSDIIT